MLKKIKKFFSANSQLWLGISIVLALLAGVLSIKAASLIIDYYYPRSKQIKNLDLPSKKPRQPASSTPSHVNQMRRLIDGVWVPVGKQNFWPVAVMIDNHPDARPPSGLAKANLVFEALAEGNITRFLAVYALDKKIDKIGPIRSARPYFLDWVIALQALYVHCGGSPQALVRIKQDNILDLNEFYRGQYFWRASNRSAPHNVYISSASLKSYLEKLNLTSAQFDPWLYKDEDQASTTLSTSTVNVVVDYGDNDFVIEWKYDKINNSYIRWQAGTVHKDEDGTLIKAKNVVVAEVKDKVIDDQGRLSLHTYGKGKILFCQQGRCWAGFWRKKNANTRIRFYDQSGQEFRFVPGVSWIEIVPDLNIAKEE